MSRVLCDTNCCYACCTGFCESLPLATQENIQKKLNDYLEKKRASPNGND
jgi:hypothetical protein